MYDFFVDRRTMISYVPYIEHAMERHMKAAATLQQRMQAALGRAGIPAKEIKVYGRQVMVTCWSRDAADRFHSLLFKFCRTMRPPCESIDYNQVNTNTVMLPTSHKVWRVWGTV